MAPKGLRMVVSGMRNWDLHLCKILTVICARQLLLVKPYHMRARRRAVYTECEGLKGGQLAPKNQFISRD